jgi:hypothetical protein
MTASRLALQILIDLNSPSQHEHRSFFWYTVNVYLRASLMRLPFNGHIRFLFSKVLSGTGRDLVNMNIQAPKTVVIHIGPKSQNNGCPENGSNDFDPISVIYRDHPRKGSYTGCNFRKIMVFAVGTGTRNINIVHTWCHQSRACHCGSVLTKPTMVYQV